MKPPMKPISLVPVDNCIPIADQQPDVDDQTRSTKQALLTGSHETSLKRKPRLAGRKQMTIVISDDDEEIVNKPVVNSWEVTSTEGKSRQESSRGGDLRALKVLPIAACAEL